jgi:hypothetical protein
LNANGSGSNSGENSRKTSTISDYTPSENTSENTILTQKQDNGENSTIIPQTLIDQIPLKQSPVRKLSRFLVSPTIIESANKELIVQEDVAMQPLNVMTQQEIRHVDIEMNINEESYQRLEPPQIEKELQTQISIGFRMPETLEQLKMELENITHAHVLTKQTKETVSLQPINLQNECTEEQLSEAVVESIAEYTSTDPVGSITTGENTSVYNSRRTSADLNTNPTDLTSTASGAIEYDNLVNENSEDANQKQILTQHVMSEG